MDENKETNIICKAIFIKKINFERTPQLPEYLTDTSKYNFNENIDFGLKINAGLNKEKTELLLEIIAELKDKKETVKINLEIIGIFSQKNEGSMTLEEFAEISAPAYMLPYIRETISYITLHSGMVPIIIPPLNIKKHLSKKNN